ncbi:MAG: HGGxSTG domain-containing protein [Thiobacillus sp.]
MPGAICSGVAVMPPVNVDANELRRQYKAWWREYHHVEALRRAILLTGARLRADYYVEHGVWPPQPALPAYPPCPPEFEGMTCGAHGRQKGRPCRRVDIFENGRCKNHGGASTGPKSAEGKARSAANLRGGAK